MRTTSQTNQFKKDYKRETKGQHRATLPDKYRDHGLTGEYTEHRECHLKPDLLLIYKKPDDATLRLVRLGSHSELF